MLTRFAYVLSAFVLLVFCAAPTTQGQSSPVPFLDEPLVPTSVAPGGPELTLTVNGTGFTSATVVNWNGVGLQTSYVSSSKLNATVPATNTAKAGTASITVSTSSGSASNAEFFFISKPTSPSFTSYHVSVPPEPATNGMQWPVVADVNGDGKLDLVGGFVNEMAVLLGNGDGSFQTPSFYPLFANITTFNSATVTGDFNGDGKPDFAFSSVNTNALAVVLGNGDGTFGAAGFITLQTGYLVNFLYAADVNGDGKLDLISGNNVNNLASLNNVSNATFSVCLGNGDGTFQSPVTVQIGNPNYLATMAIGDVNNDGKLDLIAATSGGIGAGDFILLGNGDGTFGSPISSQGLESGEQWLPADLNGDGNLDILALDGGQSGTISIYPGNGSSSFTTAGSYAIGGNYPLALTVADINVDGKLDVVAPSNNSPELGILLGNGDGTFGQSTTYLTGAGSSFGIVAADFNGDGMPDLFFGSDSASTIGIGFVLLQGSFPALTSAPTGITFSQQPLSTTSAAQSVTLTNSGQAALAISKVAIAGTNATDYAETNTCGATLAVNASCQVSITFTPAALGTRTAALSVTDNAPGSPHLISLSGQTTPAPMLSLSVSGITFPGQYVGTSGLPQTVTVSNMGDATLTIRAVTTSTGDFGVLNACGESLAASSSCSIGVFFDPTVSGVRSGTLSITSNAAGSPQSVTLSGSGEDFSISASSSSASVNPGQTATYAVALSGAGGFTQSVALSCSGAPAGSTCSLSSPSVTLSGSPTSVTVSVTTVAGSLSKSRVATIAALPKKPFLYFSFCAFPGWLIYLRTARRTRKTFPLFLTLVFITMGATGLNGCGSNKSSNGPVGTPAATYTLTVTGTFASSTANLSHSTGLTLTVQ